MPLVTVIVPNFNHARYLPQRLKGIASQRMKDFEIILLDDCSTDSSREVLTRFANDTRIPTRLAFNERNSGSPFKQWRKGAEMASGEFLWIAESDDDADAGFLEATTRAARSNEKIGLVYSQSRVIDEDGSDLGDYLRYTEDIWPGRWKSDFVNDGRDECARFLGIRNTIPNASASLVRRAALLATDRQSESMRLAGDWMTWVQVLAQSDVAFLAAPLNRFRRHLSSVRETTPLSHMFDEITRVRLRIAGMFPDDDEVLARLRSVVLSDWRRYASTVEPRDTLGWFRRHLRDLSAIGANRSPIVGLYLRYRLLHIGALRPLRRAFGTAAAQELRSRAPRNSTGEG